jgi:hypothetical protein
MRQRRGMAEMPVPQSSKAILFENHPKNEGWEWTIAWWYSSSLVIMIGIAMAPETEISTWATQEAAARLLLKDQGFTDFQFGTHYQNLKKDERMVTWDKFALKSTKMSEDDDDDDEDEDDDE